MKKSKLLIVGLFMALFTLTGCAQDNKASILQNEQSPVLQKEATLEMNKDTLDARVIGELEKRINQKREALTKEALSTIGETQSLLQKISENKLDEAIQQGERLIGKLEVLLAQDPSLELIPVNYTYNKRELVTDIETVRSITLLAQEAMDKGYYQLAGNILKDLKSELVVNSYLLPAATYPEAVKAAVVLLKNNKMEEAKAALTSVLNTVIVEQMVYPLPILNAEQMIIEAADIDAKDHKNIDKVINLLNNANYQLTLAEEMGYGKKDKEFKSLAESIDILKKSVKSKQDSKGKFDTLKEDLKAFKNKLFKASKTK